jgi:hypothetical protein
MVLRPLVLFLVGFIFLPGCSRKQEAPPPAIAVEQTPAKLEEVFKQDKAAALNAEVQNLLDDSLASLRARDYGKAVFALQSLLGRSDLSPQQRETASSALLAANKALADQASNGDKRAQELLRVRRATK